MDCAALFENRKRRGKISDCGSPYCRVLHHNALQGGYMTVYLSLTMVVLLSLCLTLIEGVRSNAIRLESEIACNIATDSIMAEYNRELMRQYNIFAIEDSYGTSSAELENVEQHLSKYVDANISLASHKGGKFAYKDFLDMRVEDARIEGALFLTDEKGEVFMRRAYEAIKDDFGIAAINELQEWMTVIEQEGLDSMDMQGQMEELQQTVNGARQLAIIPNEGIEDGEKAPLTDIVEVDGKQVNVDPAGSWLSGLSKGVLYMVCDNVSDLSANSVNASSLVYSRMRNNNINKGNLSLESENSFENAIDRFVFQEYLMKYMGCYKNTSKDDALQYQLEYIIGGKNNDIDNLSAVVNRIFGIRFAANFLYIHTDSEKCAEAESMATIISIVTFTEELISAYKELILLAWSCAEAINDTKSLLNGNRVALIKSPQTWHTNILGIVSGKAGEGDGTGLSYQDYLRILLTLTGRDNLVGRAMDIVESDIRNTEGNRLFRLDACIDTVQTNTRISSSFGYSYEFRIKRKYE